MGHLKANFNFTSQILLNFLTVNSIFEFSMKKVRNSLLLLIFLLPAILNAETLSNTCSEIDGVGSKRDSVSLAEPFVKIENEFVAPVERMPDSFDYQNAANDWKKNGVVHALFHVGVNMAQIDGDAYAGYNKIGFDVGADVMVRFHKYISASVGVGYTQWGAKYSIISNANDSLGQRYRTNLNYIQIPLAINIHDKDIIMFSAGVNLSFLAKFNERNEIGVNVTDTVQPQPKTFDASAFAALHFIIKKQFAIGVKFSYSMIPIRGVETQYKPYTHISGEYNNTLTFRFMYILSAVKKK